MKTAFYTVARFGFMHQTDRVRTRPDISRRWRACCAVIFGLGAGPRIF